jgi:predicted ATPase
LPRPLCLICDDIQWVADNQLDLMKSLAAQEREVSLFLLTLACPESLDRRPKWGRAVRSFASIYLEPLDQTAERELVGTLVQGPIVVHQTPGSRR